MKKYGQVCVYVLEFQNDYYARFLHMIATIKSGLIIFPRLFTWIFLISCWIISLRCWWPSVICVWSCKREASALKPLIGTGIIFSLSGFSALACFQITGSIPAKNTLLDSFMKRECTWGCGRYTLDFVFCHGTSNNHLFQANRCSQLWLYVLKKNVKKYTNTASKSTNFWIQKYRQIETTIL